MAAMTIADVFVRGSSLRRAASPRPADPSRSGRALAALAALALAAGCYRIHPSEGGGEISPPNRERQTASADVSVPAGYRIEAVARGLTFPTGVAFDDAGRIYVVESGYASGEVFTTPRVVRIDPGGKLTELLRGENGPWNGIDFGHGALFIAEGGVTEGGRIVRFDLDGSATTTPLVEHLPSFGDHHTNGPLVGPDGWIYFSQGTATNSGVVGPDNHGFGWLDRHPEFHDVPCKDVTLTGVNFASENPFTPDRADRATTGAFSPFGEATRAGQVIAGRVPCNGAVMRVRPDGGPVELVAWGFRNPYGLAFSARGELYATDNGYDQRGSRPVFGAGDLLWRVDSGVWYGFPDNSGWMPLDGERFHPLERAPRQAVLAGMPRPPAPVATLPVHSSSDGLDFSRSRRFGHVGDAFIAQFGDMAPGVGKVMGPVGFKVVRFDFATGVVEDFARNRAGRGPASRLGTRGLERPVAARFDRSGDALYVVDFGVLTMNGPKSRPQQSTGTLWRITREERR